MRDLRFSLRRCWGFVSSQMWHRAVWCLVPDVSKDCSAFICGSRSHCLTLEAQAFETSETTHSTTQRGFSVLAFVARLFHMQKKTRVNKSVWRALSDVRVVSCVSSFVMAKELFCLTLIVSGGRSSFSLFHDLCVRNEHSISWLLLHIFFFFFYWLLQPTCGV